MISHPPEQPVTSTTRVVPSSGLINLTTLSLISSSDGTTLGEAALFKDREEREGTRVEEDE